MGEHNEVIVCCKQIFLKSGLHWLNTLMHFFGEFEISCYCLKDIYVLLFSTPKKDLPFLMEMFCECSGLRCYLTCLY